MKSPILIVDDDQDQCDMLAAGLSGRGFAATTVNDNEQALAAMRDRDFAAAIVDVYLGDDDGLELCAHAAENYPGMPVVVMTGQGDMTTAIRAIRAGAYDFIQKPLRIDGVALVLERASEIRRLREEIERLRRDNEPHNFDNLILGKSRAMMRVFDLITQVAPGEATVLISGESGTGKELVARSIHDRSRRAHGPFVAINCAAVTSSLLESELFGHVKGAFTDARRSRSGLFVQASGGTLFLDEIGEMPLDMQAKLLRVLQEGAVRPVGGDAEEAFDTRIVAATNRDLETEVEEERFREDLFYRVNVVRIEVPPLRSRGDDVLLMAQRFLEKHAVKAQKEVAGISDGAARKLMNYDWPGNVRELQNAIERAVTLTRFDKIIPEDLPDRINSHRSNRMVLDSDNPDEMPTLLEVERRYIQRVLEAVQGNKTHAARVLGVNRRTMYRKLDRLELKG